MINLRCQPKFCTVARIPEEELEDREMDEVILRVFLERKDFHPHTATILRHLKSGNVPPDCFLFSACWTIILCHVI